MRPLRVVVTGGDGFVGRHLRAHLLVRGIDAVSLGRERFDDDQTRDRILGHADVVCHIAGINRGSDDELEQGNIDLAARLVESLARTQAAPVVVNANSTKQATDSPYGRGKRSAADVLQAMSNG